ILYTICPRRRPTGLALVMTMMYLSGERKGRGEREVSACISVFPSSDHVPSRNWIMPRMPAMLVTRVTRFPVRRAASLSRISPVGRSIDRAGALGLEGEEKMYESDAVCT